MGGAIVLYLPTSPTLSPATKSHCPTHNSRILPLSLYTSFQTLDRLSSYPYSNNRLYTSHCEFSPRKGLPMPTLKKSAIATITAAALATGICAPAANAAGVKVNGGICVLAHTEAEQKATDMPWSAFERVYAQDEIKLTFERIKHLEDLYANKSISEAKYNEEYAYLRTTLPALRACAAGRDMSASSAEIEAFMSSLDGKELSDAGIGIVAASAVVVVLAGLVAALPQIKPMLPANIQAMLP